MKVVFIHALHGTCFFFWARLSALSDDDVAELQSKLDQEVDSNLGMAMIYTLITAAQEWMNEKVWPWIASL